MTTLGIKYIWDKRYNQIHKHGYTRDHDLQHSVEDFENAAVAIILEEPQYWPFADGYKTEPDQLERLSNAGALIIAAIERYLVDHPEDKK